MLCDLALGYPWLVVPQEARRLMFELLFGISPPGIHASQHLFGNRFMWFGMRKDVAAQAQTYYTCQVNEVSCHHHSPVLHIPVPNEPFSHIHKDFVGPLPPSHGHEYLFTVIDRCSRLPKAIPLRSTMAADCIQALLLHWVAWFGVPHHLTSDWGHQFTSAFWTALPVMVHHTSAYHPLFNRVVECFHQSLKASLCTRLSSLAWTEQHPWVLLGLLASVRRDLVALRPI